MIVQRERGKLICVQTGRIWLQRKDEVLLDVPSLEEYVRLHDGKDGADCRAFLESLAIRLGAVRWDADKRAFVPVSGGSDG